MPDGSRFLITVPHGGRFRIRRALVAQPVRGRFDQARERRFERDVLDEDIDDDLPDATVTAGVAGAAVGGELASNDASAGDDPGPWSPAFDEADDLDGLLSARSPLLSRAFRTADRSDG